MLYQKLLLGNNPFYISVGKALEFETHRHPELELSYCLKGEYNVICENKLYSLRQGDFLIISPMASHEIPANNRHGEMLTIDVGYAFLGEFFKEFTNHTTTCRLYQKNDSTSYSANNELVELLEEIARIHKSNSALKELNIKGNLYKISALLLQITCDVDTDTAQNKKMTDIENVEMALEKIYNNYYEPLNSEDISTSCGYSKSNFCKIFKAITGDTFHSTLNRHRIEIACMLLSETNYTIEKIAHETGFLDSKNFCRVFKKIMGKSAGVYRNKKPPAKPVVLLLRV